MNQGLVQMCQKHPNAYGTHGPNQLQTTSRVFLAFEIGHLPLSRQNANTAMP